MELRSYITYGHCHFDWTYTVLTTMLTSAPGAAEVELAKSLDELAKRMFR